MADLKTTLSHYFQSFEGLREELSLALEGWDTPTVVVFGPQNSGKSTLLERLTMISMFPKGDGLCTRMPIRIRMRTGDPQDARLSIIAIEKQREEVIDSKELSGDVGAEIRETMNTLIAELHQSERGIRTDRLIQVELWAEDYPNLDLLDLPGIVVNAGPNDVETLPKDTYQLVIDTIEQTKGRAIYLAVREAGDNVHNSMTIKVLRQCPEIKDHCLGVLTKCDRYADDLIIEELKASEEWALGYGYVATMNKPISDSHNLEALAEAERSWFKKTEERVELIERKQGGCDELSHKLSAVYHNYLRESWVPNTMRRLSHSILKKEHQLASLGEPFFEGKPTDEELGALNSAFQELLGHLQMKLASEVETLFRELPIWEGSSFPAGTIQYEHDYNKNKRIRITSRSKLIKLMAHPTENLVSRFMQILETPLHAFFESQIQTVRQLLDEDQFAVKPITSVRLGRFATLSERLVELLKGSKFEVQILQRLKQETERYFVGHIDYRFDDDPNSDYAFINHLSQLRSRLITAMSMTTSHEFCRLSINQLDLNEEELFQDESKPVREALDNELKLIEGAQEHLIELFDLECADSYASYTPLDFNELWDKNGLIWHLGSKNGQISRALAESAFKISTSQWEYGNVWQVILHRGYTECISSRYQASPWYEIELNEGELLLDGYTIRNGCRNFHMTSWIIKGITNVGKELTLDQRTDDFSLSNGDSSAYFRVSHCPEPIVKVKLMMTGVNSAGSNCLPLSGIELYGLYLEGS